LHQNDILLDVFEVNLAFTLQLTFLDILSYPLVFVICLSEHSVDFFHVVNTHELRNRPLVQYLLKLFLLLKTLVKIVLSQTVAYVSNKFRYRKVKVELAAYVELL